MRPLSPTDSTFLWIETRNQPMHVAGLNIYTPPQDATPHFVSEMLAKWRRHVHAKAPFNQRPVLRMGLWYWQDDLDFELDYHVRHLALPQPGRIRELLAMVSRLHGNVMDRSRPLWEMYVIEGLPGGRFATYTKMHHALIDGISGARLTARAHARSVGEDKAPLWDQDLWHRTGHHDTARPASLLDQFQNLLQAGREILPGLASGVGDMLRSTQPQTALGLPFQAPPTPFNVKIAGARRFAAQSYSLARLKRIGEASGATVNDVTLAICGGALRRYLEAQDALPDKPLIAMVPVSLHGPDSGGSNQVTLLLANLGTHIADPLERLKCIVESTSQAKRRFSSMTRLEKLAHGATSISPMGLGMITGSAQKHPPFNVVISNVPGPQEVLYLNGARLDEVYPVSIPIHFAALNITISGYGDNLGFGYTACRRSVPQLQRMLDYTEASIEELEEALHASGRTANAPVQKTMRGKPMGQDKTLHPGKPAQKKAQKRSANPKMLKSSGLD